MNGGLINCDSSVDRPSSWIKYLPLGYMIESNTHPTNVKHISCPRATNDETLLVLYIINNRNMRNNWLLALTIMGTPNSKGEYIARLYSNMLLCRSYISKRGHIRIWSILIIYIFQLLEKNCYHRVLVMFFSVHFKLTSCISYFTDISYTQESL